MAYISLEHVVKRYKMGEVTITAVDDITFDIEKGEFVIIVGPSGAGKTTVLNILGGMDACDEGTILVDGKEISKCNSRQLTTYRRYDIGFVFQFYNLIQNLTALENVELAAQICKEPLPAQEVLCHVGLGERLNNFPRPALRRRAAAGSHCPCAGQKPQAAAVRRAHRRAGLHHRQGHLKAPSGHLPPAGDDGGGHHPQHRHCTHGRQGDPREKRPGGPDRAQRESHARGRD